MQFDAPLPAAPHHAAPTRRLWPLLGTYVEVGVVASGAVAEAGLAAARACLEQAQARWSFQAPDSELTRLNQARGAWVKLPRQTVLVSRVRSPLEKSIPRRI